MKRSIHIKRPIKGKNAIQTTIRVIKVTRELFQNTVMQTFVFKIISHEFDFSPLI